MIDAHDAQEILRLFRMRFVDDEHAFHAVAHLRRSILASESDLIHALEISPQACKSLLRTLHQAGMVSAMHDRLFRLTLKGEFLSDQLGISTAAAHSVAASFRLEPLDQAFLETHISLEEIEGAAIGKSLLWYQSLAVNAAWCSRPLRQDLVRRAAQALAVAFIPWSKIEKKDRADALWCNAKRELDVEAKTAKRHFVSRLRSAEADAELCNHFVLRAELPKSRDARAVVLLVTASRMLASLLSQNSHRSQGDQELQWSIRRNADVSKRVCAEVAAWDRELVEADLEFSGHWSTHSLRQESHSGDRAAQALFAALAGVFLGAVIPLALGIPVHSHWPRQVKNSGDSDSSSVGPGGREKP